MFARVLVRRQFGESNPRNSVDRCEDHCPVLCQQAGARNPMRP
jgi:hypothetical protein